MLVKWTVWDKNMSQYDLIVQSSFFSEQANRHKICAEVVWVEQRQTNVRKQTVSYRAIWGSTGLKGNQTGSCRTIQDNTVSKGTIHTIQHHMKPYGTTWDHMGPWGTIWDYTGPYWTLWDHTGPYEAVRAIQDRTGLNGTIQDQTWPHGTIFVHIGTYWTIGNHAGPLRTIHDNW